MLPAIHLSEVSLVSGGARGLVVDFAALAHPDVQRLQKLLSASEQARYASIVLESERQSQSMTRATLRLVLGCLLRLAPDRLGIAIGVHGKPFCSNAPDLRFSVSHSGSFGLLAFCQGAEVGCDIEIKREVADFEAMGALVLHPAERRALALLPKPAQQDAFLRLWVRKEAVIKAIGLGFMAEPTSIQVTQHQCTVALKAPDGHPIDQAVTLHDSPVVSAYRAAVASPYSSCHWARLQL